MSTLAADLDLVTEQDYASLRGVELATLRNERAKKIGPPFVVLGRVVYYPKSAIMDLIKASTRLAEPKATLINPKPRKSAIRSKHSRRDGRVGATA